MVGRFIGIPKSGSFLCKWHKKVATSNGNPVLFIRALVLIESEPRLFSFVLTRFLARTGIHFARKRYRAACWARTKQEIVRQNPIFSLRRS
jgi:hypothetical protein